MIFLHNFSVLCCKQCRCQNFSVAIILVFIRNWRMVMSLLCTYCEIAFDRLQKKLFLLLLRLDMQNKIRSGFNILFSMLPQSSSSIITLFYSSLVSEIEQIIVMFCPCKRATNKYLLKGFGFIFFFLEIMQILSKF